MTEAKPLSAEEIAALREIAKECDYPDDLRYLATIDAQAEQIARLVIAMENIRGQLGSCRIQRTATDDSIIAEHIDSCYDAARKALVMETIR